MQETEEGHERYNKKLRKAQTELEAVKDDTTKFLSTLFEIDGLEIMIEECVKKSLDLNFESQRYYFNRSQRIGFYDNHCEMIMKPT